MADNSSNPMTRDELLAEVERLGPWLHAIALGQGVITKTKSSSGEPDDHPLGEWQVIKECLPANLAGKSLLDVGCNAGCCARARDTPAGLYRESAGVKRSSLQLVLAERGEHDRTAEKRRFQGNRGAALYI